MENIYQNIPLKDIPWNIEDPPKQLRELLTTKKVELCKAIDLGCGAGNYAIYMAKAGFDVTGIDISPTAIRLAKENAMAKDISCRFLVADVIKEMVKNIGKFDFAYDWALLHHIYPQLRKQYLENVNKLLSPGSKYLSVCFSIEDPQFGGAGNYRKTGIGTVLYFSTEDEMRTLFSQYFTILELKTIILPAKHGIHKAIYVFMEKK